jgi:hypothetical protein
MGKFIPEGGFVILPMRKPRGYYRRIPHFRDLSDYHRVGKKPRFRRIKDPKKKEGPELDNNNYYAVFGRYRVRTAKQAPEFWGSDFNGKPLGNNSLLGKFITFKDGKVFNTVNQFVGGTLTLSDANTQTWDSLNPGPPYRTGGPFFSADCRLPESSTFGLVTCSDLGKSGITSDNKTVYYGRIVDNGNWGSDTRSSYRVSKPSPRVLTAYHTLAWDSLKPHVSAVNVSQFVYELKDLPHMLKTSLGGFKTIWEGTQSRFNSGHSWKRVSEFMAPRNAADHFLNHNFGWVPFISDLKDIIQTYLNSRDLLARSVRDNGRWKRRERVLETKENDSLLNRFYGGAMLPGSGNFRMDALCDLRTFDGIPCRGITDIRLHETTTTWACGSFKFYRPEFDDNLIGFESELMNVQRLLTLYGVRINPTTLWKITPWTWLIDWFTHFGDFISHWDEWLNDGILSKYLYVMQEVRRHVIKTATLFLYSGAISHSWQRSLVTKRREAADSPYGFNRPWSSLTPKQWAIIGAIGIGRTPSSSINTGL